MQKLEHGKNQNTRYTSPRIIMIGFAGIIFIGAILLALPVSASSGISIGFLDALFTSTSAVCVTGLAVLDTGTDFSLFGQIVLMALIQIGGLGFMTFGVLVAILLGKKISLKERLLIQQSTNSISMQGVVRLSLGIFTTAFIIEACAATLLAARWSSEMGLKRAIYYGIFHSISSFNNAGFALWSDSLSRYVGDPLVNIVITLLFILGGIGFVVIMDIWNKRRWRTLSLNTKVVLITTGLLSLAGFLFVFVIECFNPRTFGDLSWSERLWAGYFQGVVPRTAGFNTIDIGGMMTASQLFIIFLMFIGASSGSTGGGIKTSTFAVLYLSVAMIVKGKGDLNILKRRLPHELILRALAVIVVSLSIVLTSTFLLTLTEHSLQKDFMEVLFEATSAFGTVGLSMGLTSELSPLGKTIIIMTMYIGRLGPLTLFFAISQRSSKGKFRYPEERLLIG
ncbi:MAG: TrkH family potassium uptake protein [Paenibacillus dendritiformis]|uniref:TrkH family potassium uptake protein n=1 Tax=Paenibacillus dendritiformis TaxID=130049 RepID=UPI00143CD1DA|nr:TrkH family potassium uptake protein [Paenibacillus dendritiformis]MDU5145834.1 TrkH family potassium uptake protein [Paenibacillus dendritiformis]NKI24359.1 Ktr system potassium transporter B [Paenibacillus dendritiformis]NRF98204.1 Ktr system potassium transporter B [Paenibacillus dendritiformis]GIO71197.1 Ktr system potassium transporter B [Paenibacillus dendritiformis]